MVNALKIENEIIRICVQWLGRYLGKDPAVRPLAEGRWDIPWNALITLKTRPAIQLAAEVKRGRHMTPAQARHAAVGAQNAKPQRIVFARHVPEAAAVELRRNNRFFVDTLGNAYVKLPKCTVLLDVRGRKDALAPYPQPGRLLEPTGLKVIHLLMTRPGAATFPYRQIAQGAGVALGTVAVVFKELKRTGFLETGPQQQRRLANWKGLVDHFVTGYGLKLRPACERGRFRHKERNLQTVLRRFEKKLAEQKWARTGGIAAELMTQYLRPDKATLFVTPGATQILHTEPMLPAAGEGGITLLDYFAPTLEDAREPHCATPLLVYAELIHDGRPRELETAGLINDKHLKEPPQ